MPEMLNDSELEKVIGGSCDNYLADDRYVGPCFRYEIRRGDCLSVIAQRINTTVRIILSLNTQITNPDKLSVGELILLPGIDLDGNNVHI